MKLAYVKEILEYVNQTPHMQQMRLSALVKTAHGNKFRINSWTSLPANLPEEGTLVRWSLQFTPPENTICLNEHSADWLERSLENHFDEQRVMIRRVINKIKMYEEFED